MNINLNLIADGVQGQLTGFSLQFVLVHSLHVQIREQLHEKYTSMVSLLLKHRQHHGRSLELNITEAEGLGMQSFISHRHFK